MENLFYLNVNQPLKEDLMMTPFMVLIAKHA